MRIISRCSRRNQYISYGKASGDGFPGKSIDNGAAAATGTAQPRPPWSSNRISSESSWIGSPSDANTVKKSEQRSPNSSQDNQNRDAILPTVTQHNQSNRRHEKPWNGKLRSNSPSRYKLDGSRANQSGETVALPDTTTAQGSSFLLTEMRKAETPSRRCC